MKPNQKPNNKPKIECFEEQILLHQNSLMMFAFKLTNNKADAEDLSQKTILKAIKNKEKYITDINLKGWLFTVMRNIFINEYRSNNVLKRSTEITEGLNIINSSQMSGLSTPEGVCTLSEIEDAISNINEKFSTPFTMYIAGFKYNEIADKLNLPIGTIKSRIFLARKILSDLLKEYR